MSSSLFIDTSGELTVGVLDSNFEFTELFKDHKVKTSKVLHHKIFELLENQNLKIEDISTVFTAAGPGSYTGMRVSEGVLQIFECFDFGVHSFYHFELPQLLGKISGVWFSTAYKNEYFVYQWDENRNQRRLISKEILFDEYLNNSKFEGQLYSSYKSSYSFEVSQGVHKTSQLIQGHSKEIFRTVLSNKLRREPFYYRKLHEEFKIS